MGDAFPRGHRIAMAGRPAPDFLPPLGYQRQPRPMPPADQRHPLPLGRTGALELDINAQRLAGVGQLDDA